MAEGSSIRDMIDQSKEVLTKPSVATFERFEGRGTVTDAILYVAIAAAISGIFGLTEGLSGFLGNLVSTILGFLIFTYLVHWIGQRRGGTGSFDHVAYSFALFWAPLSVIFAVVSLLLLITIIGIVLIPLVALVAIAANVYFAYLAVQSSTNLQGGGPTWTVLLLAALGALILNLIVAAIIG